MELSLKNREWGQFKLSSIFKIENCKCSKVADLQTGKIPYVGATNRNNGVMSFVKSVQNLKTKGNCIAFICDGEGSVGYSIYKKEDFIGSTTVKVGRSPFLNKYVGIFITTIADTVRSKYNFGFKRNSTHLKNEILILPINSQGSPDYEFMENYMRAKEQEKTNAYKNYISKRICQIENTKEVVPLTEKDWEEFRIQELFETEKGNQNNMSSLKSGNIPLISAKKDTNGLKDFVSKNNKKQFEKHCLTLNNDGDGGAGISYYQPFDFLLDSHVTALRPKSNLSKSTLLFISRSITKQRDKFGHGYSINNSRLSVFTIMLPVNDNHEPDYEYMENYMKQLELNKLKKYLEYKKLNIND